MTTSRRKLLAWSGGAIALTAVPIGALLARRERSDKFGPLLDDPSGVLDLPADFTYRILDRSGDRMDDGFLVPGLPDGMGCFPREDGTLVLLRNHELTPSDAGIGGWPDRPPPPEAFDARSVGGVTRLVVDARTFERRSHNLVLAGTNRNCAGGASPWGWLSCEEDVSPGHGYVFLCRPETEKVAPPERIAAYGRFYHEAATVDPTTLVAYLTEDRMDGCLYRFVPDDPARPFEGRLEALRVRGHDRFDTGDPRNLAGAKVDIDWVEVAPGTAGAEPADDLRVRAHAAGAAVVVRGEGLFLGDDVLWVACTAGGPRGDGRILRVSIAEQQLTSFAESPSGPHVEMPDNIALSPWGDLLVAEDASGRDYLRGITPRGEVYDIARNARSLGELAGICAAPTGDALFVNLQRDGLTLVITGPFAERWDAPVIRR